MNQQAIAAAGVYAVLSTFILFWLAEATGRIRRRHQILIGDGGLPELTKVMRGHANAAENIPMMVALLVISALLGAPTAAIHAAGATFVLGRAIHAWHFTHEPAPLWQRFVGFGLGALAMTVTAVGVLDYSLLILVRA